MTDPLLYYTYLYITLETILLVGAAVYCVRLTRITGVFRAWIFLIAALGLLAFLVLASYVNMIVFKSAATLEATIQASTPLAIVGSSAVGLALSLLLFLAMFELFRTFRRFRDHGPTPAVSP